MTHDDVNAAVALQPLAFPPPFSPDLHWDPEHLHRHIEVFPEGQLVAQSDDQIVGTCSNTRIPEAAWQAHGNWGQTVGGPNLRNFDPQGSTLYGLDITVHPECRRLGIGRAFYAFRYDYVRSQAMARYGTGCRLPDYRAYASRHAGVTVESYAERVVRGDTTDRTLTPLLRYDLALIGVLRDYMHDPESDNAAALLEWRP